MGWCDTGVLGATSPFFPGIRIFLENHQELCRKGWFLKRRMAEKKGQGITPRTTSVSTMSKISLVRSTMQFGGRWSGCCCLAPLFGVTTKPIRTRNGRFGPKRLCVLLVVMQGLLLGKVKVLCWCLILLGKVKVDPWSICLYRNQASHPEQASWLHVL